MAIASAASSQPQAASSAPLERLTFAALDGWRDDAHEAAFAAFLKHCATMRSGRPPLRAARPAQDALIRICLSAFTLANPDRDAARRFFEAAFEPWQVASARGTGLLTGYYEPEFSGSLQRNERYSVPLLARPDDLETIAEGDTRPGIDPGLRGARRVAGGFTPYPTRKEIDEGALGDAAKPVVYLARPSQAFIIQVQGSARIHLDDGRAIRVAYAGRNGQPYTSIGGLLIQRGAIAPDEMSLERLLGWLDANPGPARDIMHSNKSYVFFRIADELGPDDGPIGGAGTPLTAGRSLAVDRRFWSYGLPFWLEGTLPLDADRQQPLRRLMIAQDTGSAIVGAARGDFFVGSGAAAGTTAGLMRHQARFVVLQSRGWRPDAGPATEGPGRP